MDCLDASRAHNGLLVVVGHVEKQVPLWMRHQYELAPRLRQLIELRLLVEIIGLRGGRAQLIAERGERTLDHWIHEVFKERRDRGTAGRRLGRVAGRVSAVRLPEKEEAVTRQAARRVELVGSLHKDLGNVLQAGGPDGAAGVVVEQLVVDVLVVVCVVLPSRGLAECILQGIASIHGLQLGVPDAVEKSNRVSEDAGWRVRFRGKRDGTQEKDRQRNEGVNQFQAAHRLAFRSVAGIAHDGKNCRSISSGVVFLVGDQARHRVHGELFQRVDLQGGISPLVGLVNAGDATVQFKRRTRQCGRARGVHRHRRLDRCSQLCQRHLLGRRIRTLTDIGVDVVPNSVVVCVGAGETGAHVQRRDGAALLQAQDHGPRAWWPAAGACWLPPPHPTRANARAAMATWFLRFMAYSICFVCAGHHRITAPPTSALSTRTVASASPPRESGEISVAWPSLVRRLSEFELSIGGSLTVRPNGVLAMRTIGV